MAEVCLLSVLHERLLTGKLTIKIQQSGVIYDPKQTRYSTVIKISC